MDRPSTSGLWVVGKIPSKKFEEDHPMEEKDDPMLAVAMLGKRARDLMYTKCNVGSVVQESTSDLQVDRKKLRMTTVGMTPEGKRFFQTTSVSQVTCTGNLVDEIFGSGINKSIIDEDLRTKLLMERVIFLMNLKDILKNHTKNYIMLMDDQDESLMHTLIKAREELKISIANSDVMCDSLEEQIEEMKEATKEHQQMCCSVLEGAYEHISKLEKITNDVVEMLDEEATLPDEIIASLESMLADLKKKSDQLYNESDAMIKEIQATLNNICHVSF